MVHTVVPGVPARVRCVAAKGGQEARPTNYGSLDLLLFPGH
jgi:hypothetical protein